MKLREPFAILTNLVFLLPFYFAVAKNEYLWALIIISLFVFSIIFHLSKPIGATWWHKTKTLTNLQKFFLWTDTFFAIFLIIFNFFILFEKSFSTEILMAIILAIIALIIFFFPAKKKYDINHGIWHIISGIITFLIIVG